MAMTLISTNTADDDSSLAITSGIDSTYKLYIFKFLNVHCAVDTADLRFQVNATDNTGYNDSAITTSAFQAKHAEDDGTASLAYDADFDEAQTTGDADIQKYLGSGSDESMSGEIFLFNPSNTTYVKHFLMRFSNYSGSINGSSDFFVGGYINDTTAIDDIRFIPSTGNMSGTIKLYGVG